MTNQLIAIARPKFPLGRIVITLNAQARLDPAEVQQGLSRHASGDWGDIPPEDREENDLLLHEEGRYRLMSAYGQGERRFWIITEWDRTVTTVLLPLDY